MIKLKNMIKFLSEDETPISNIIPSNEGSTKSINDEFKVNDWMLSEVKKKLEKVNKKLKARNMPELNLVIVKEEIIISIIYLIINGN